MADAGRDPKSATVSTRVFALPIVIVTGSARAATLAGVLPDIAAINALFQERGVLGKTRNFGFSNALCAVETLEAVSADEVYAWTHAPHSKARELPPAPIDIAGSGEQVDLRFLVGAGIVASAEPSFVETASNIGIWGMQATRLLAAHLAQPGIEVLPLPRPPADFLQAAAIGRRAHAEIAFDLFVSSTLRRYRSAVGDPTVEIGTDQARAITVVFSSPFDASLRATFEWPLHGLDDAGDIVLSIVTLLDECGVRNLPRHGSVSLT